MTKKTRNLVNAGALGPTSGQRTPSANPYAGTQRYANGAKVAATQPGRSPINHSNQTSRSWSENAGLGGINGKGYCFPYARGYK